MTILRLHNRSAMDVYGWFRCNVDVLPPHGSGGTPFGNYVLGNRSGLDTHSLDVKLGLAPGEQRAIDLTTAEDIGYTPLVGIDPDAKAAWGGIPVTVAGKPLAFLGAVPNGAAFDGHWRGRVGSMLVVDLFVSWYPDDPRRANGEVVITASNPAIPDIAAQIPPLMQLVFGDALVMVPGLPTDAPLMWSTDWLADGQRRFLPLVLCWPRHAPEGEAGYLAQMCREIADQQVQVNGLARLHADGNPHLPPGFDAVAWTDQMLPQVIDRQHDWFNSPLDPAYVSGAAGAQGGQSFVGGPAMADPAAVGPLYLAALDGSWPMFHLEADGSPLDWKGHPGMRMFYGRVNRRICPDTLGKERDPSLAESHGYAGPEDEHWFDWPAWAAARLKGTPATQMHLRAHATNFLFRYVVEAPGNWLTANRGVGWMCFLAVELYRNLADRELAEAVKTRWLAVYDQLIVPWAAGDAWWGWLTDARLGPGLRTAPWQASVFALGLDWAGAAFGRAGARDLAHHAARQIIERTYVQHEGRWTSRPIIAQDGSPVDYAAIGLRLGYYDFFGTPMSVACLLRHEPEHEPARSIWTQLVREATTLGQASWLQPGLAP